MTRSVDIRNFLKVLMMLLSVLFMLTACSGDEQSKTSDQTIVDQKEDAEKLAANHSECWVSAIVTGVYDAMGTASLSMYSKITEGALGLMMVAFAVWMSFRMLEHLSSVKEVNPNEFWTEILRKLAICFVCGVLASSTGGLLFILNTVIFPIYNAFLEFGAEILNVASSQMPKDFYVDVGVGDVHSSGLVNETPIVCKIVGSASIDLGAEKPAFPEGPKKMMQCLICAVWSKLDFGYVMAFQAMKMPGIVTKVVGVFIFLCFTFVKVGFAFYIVDTIFKMAIMCVILPLLIMSYAFKQTKEYTSKGFKIILSSSVFMMFISIVISMTLMAMQEVMNNKLPEAMNPNRAGAASAVDVVTEQQTGSEQPKTAEESKEDLKKRLNAEGDRDLDVVAMSLVMICFLVVGSIGVAQEVTGNLLDTGISAEFQKKIKVLGEAALGVLTGGAGSLLMRVKKVREAAEKIKKIQERAAHIAGRDGS